MAIRSKNKKIYQLNQYKNIELVEIGHTKNIIETIYKTLNFIDSEWVLINPITTIPTSDYPPYAFIEFGKSTLLRLMEARQVTSSSILS